MAAVSKALVDLVRANLERVPAPKDYDSFRNRLIDSKPNREPPMIKESPENTRRIGVAEAE